MNKQNTDHTLFSGYLYAIAATMIWSGNFIIARGLHESIPPITLAFWRWVVAVAVFLPFAIRPLIADWDVLKNHIPYLCITAITGVTVFNTLIYIAGHTTSAINLSLIAITVPVFIVILSRLVLHELITVYKITGIILVAVGVGLLITGGMPERLIQLTFVIGDVWMLIAAFVFSVYSILLKRKPAELSIWSLQLSTFLLGLAFLFPFYLWEHSIVEPVVFGRSAIYSIIYLGIFASLLAFIFWNRAIVLVGPAKAGMVYNTLPLFSGVLAYVLLSEKIGLLHVLTAILIISGIVVANSGKSVLIGQK